MFCAIVSAKWLVSSGLLLGITRSTLEPRFIEYLMTLCFAMNRFFRKLRYNRTNVLLGFMTHVAEPLFVEWNRFLSTSNSTIMMENLRKNRSKWQSMANQSRSHSNSNERLIEEKRRRDCSGADDDDDDFDVVRSRHTESLDNGSSSPAVRGRRKLHPRKDRVTLTCRRDSPPVDDDLVSNSCQHVRRLSLPASDCRSHRNFFSLISRLAPGFENLRLDEEPERRSVSTEDRHSSIEDNTTAASSAAVHRLIGRADDKTSSRTHARFAESANSIPSLGDAGGLPSDEKILRKQPACPAADSCPSNFHGCWRAERKLSLISAHDQRAVTLVIGRKRSRSLATSTLVGTFEDDPGSGFWHIPNGEASSEQLLVTSAGGGLWTTWWQKKVRNSFCRSKISQPNSSDGTKSFCKKSMFVWNFFTEYY